MTLCPIIRPAASAVQKLLPSSRNFTTATTLNAFATAPETGASDRPYMPLTPAQKAFLASAIRTNQAGELAAVQIYRYQTPPLLTTHPRLRPTMAHMLDQEAGHLRVFDKLVADHRVRPSALLPLWGVAGAVLGHVTAAGFPGPGGGLFAGGREAAMACTEAVETEIGYHYNEQLEELREWRAEAAERGMRLDPELEKLETDIRRIRDEELEHLDRAVQEDSKEAKPYAPLIGIVKAGCRAAIEVCRRI